MDHYREYLETHSIPEPNTGCWIWLRGINSEGYGIAHISKKDAITEPQNIRAHRLSYLAFNGNIPKGKLICHRCDVRHCINPQHLFIGTARDNTNDAVSKGRWVQGNKLSKEDVIKIRELASLGQTQRRLAAQFNVSHGVIFRTIHKQMHKRVV